MTGQPDKFKFEKELWEPARYITESGRGPEEINGHVAGRVKCLSREVALILQ